MFIAENARSGPTNQSTTLEAILGAVHLDGGDDKLDRVLKRLGLLDAVRSCIGD